jgi:hypothetical protein
VRIAGSLLFITACATGDEPAASISEPQPEPGMRLRVVDAQGAALGLSSDKRDVFIGLSGMVTQADIVDADYAFQVIDQTGAVLSLDDSPCRRFHVDSAGQLALVDSACRHEAGAGNVQLMPFADAEPDDSGAMHFIVQIAPADTSFDASSLKATFAVAASPSS